LIRIEAAYRKWTAARLAIVAAILLVAVAAPGFGQDFAQPLPLDPAIRTGRLPNGLTYFIRRNVRPEKRAMLRLAVKAGSVDEADDQLGLAHMLEHMAFNGGTHFAPGELVKYLESIGARFGPHVNAYTSYDETVYMLDVPTDRAGVLTRGFEALSDFAGGITLDEREVDRERGVVIEEWRGRQGAATRMQKPQMDALFGASRYAERLPIGTPEILQSFPAQRLRDFYRDHYRADRMAVIVVGDIEVEAIEALVRGHFAALPTLPPAPRPVYPVPPHADTRYVAVSDPEAQGSSVSIMMKRPMQPFVTVGDYRRLIVRSLVTQMINERLAEIARQPEAPFLRAGAGDSAISRTVESFGISARVADGGIDRGLSALAQELSRIRQFGFGEAELERAKLGLLAGYERAYNERNTSESANYARELLQHVLTDEPAPGIEMELAIVRRFLPEITTEDAAELAREAVREDSRVVLATSPEKAGVARATDASLREALRVGLAAPVTAWRDATAGRSLMATPPTPGSVRARREIPELGVTVLTLSNGAEVWLKPTDFRADQILFTSYARGGISLAPPEEYFNASLSASLVGIAGVGGFTPIDLGKLLAGKIAGASAYVSTSTHGVSGNATPRDLETAMQLLHLQFTAPNRDAEAFVLMKERLQATLANQEQNPGSVFGERVRAVNTMDHFTSRSLKAGDLPTLDPQRMLAFYDARFANAADFTFFFAGSFTVEQITPLLTTYVASLPSTGTPSARFGNLSVQFPTAVRREAVNKGREPRSQTAITFFADTGLDELEAHRARAASSVVQMRLRDLLREELGGTYSVGVGYSDMAPLPGYGTMSVQFGSSPENAERLMQAVLREVERLKAEGPSAADVQAVKEAEKNDLQTSFRQNGFWMNSLQAAHLLGRDPLRILQRVERADSLTTDNIHAALRKYFPSDRYTVVTLMPEAAGRPAAQ
jgi:zinc protease